MTAVSIDTDPAALDAATSVRVISAALEYAAANGGLSAEKIIELGCMTPDCLTATTLVGVARLVGCRPSDLMV